MQSKPRYRTAGGFIGQPVTWISYDRFTCLTGAYDNWGGPRYDYAKIGTLRTMQDWVAPHFRERSRKGEVIIHPFSSSIETQLGGGTFSRVRSVANSCTSPTTKNEEDLSGPYSLYAFKGLSRLDFASLIAQSEIDEAVRVAATRAWKDSNGHEADVLTDIAEYRQTVRMLANPLSAMDSLMRSIKQSQKKGSLNVKGVVAGAARSAQDLWLQYRFGVRPIVSTVKGVIEALNEPKPKRRWTARGKYTLNNQSSEQTSGSTWSTTCSYRIDRTDQVIVRAGILLEEEVTLQQSVGIDASGMLSLPWELVPYSFVADWFLNVGDYISSLVPYFSKHPLGSWWTVERRRTSKYDVLSTSAATSTYTIVRPVTDHREGSLVEKTRYLALPGPSLTAKPQSLNAVLHDLRLIDSFALACQRIGTVFKG